MRHECKRCNAKCECIDLQVSDYYDLCIVENGRHVSIRISSHHTDLLQSVIYRSHCTLLWTQGRMYLKEGRKTDTVYFKKTINTAQY